MGVRAPHENVPVIPAVPKTGLIRLERYQHFAERHERPPSALHCVVGPGSILLTEAAYFVSAGIFRSTISTP